MRVSTSRLKNLHVSLLLMKILFYLLTQEPWILNHFLFSANLLSCSDFPFVTPVLLLISTWFFFNPRGKFKFSEKQKTNLKYRFFKAGVVKYFSQSQTVANQIKLFIFVTPKYRKYFGKF